MHNGMIQIDLPLKATVWSAGQYRVIPCGLVSGYPACANIALYRERDTTAGPDLTEGK